MFRRFDTSLIEARLQRLARIEEDSDPVFELLRARRKTRGDAQSNPDLMFTGFDLKHFRSIVRQGLLAGKAIDPRNDGANAASIWFKRGVPFYAGYPTFVIGARRLIELGGQGTGGLAGQGDVYRLGFETRPQGIPVEEFAIGYTFSGGFIVPVYKPTGWNGPIGDEISLGGLR